MSKAFPKAKRPREDLILDFMSKQHVKGEIVQYLASHQISGLRFLYKCYKNNKSCFLNDEHEMGKVFQMVAFLSAVCDGTANGIKVLILCQNTNKLLHWNYHCSVLLPKVKTLIADNRKLNADDDSESTASCIILSSMDNAMAHLDELKKVNYRFVIVHDEQLEVNFDALVQVRTLISDDTRIVIVCSADILANTRYFYQMLKLCNLRLPLFVNDESNEFLKFNDFNMKFGGGNTRNASKRNSIFRQKNLLNVCQDFYLRRFRQQEGSILPLVDKTIYEKCFNQWKTSQSDQLQIEASWFDDDMEVPPPQGAATEKTACDHEIVDPIVAIRCDDYESQMSPLVYHSSESDVDDNDEVPTKSITLKNNKRTTSRTKETSNSDDNKVTHRTLRSQNTKRKLRSSGTKQQPEATSRHRWLSGMKLKATKKSDSKQKNVNGSSKNEMSADSCSSGSTTTTTTTTTTKSSIFSNGKNTGDTLTFSQDTTSDILLVQEEHMTPITISSSSDTITDVPNENTPNVNYITQSLRVSPDIFSSPTAHTDENVADAMNSSADTTPIPAGQSRFAKNQTDFEESDAICTQDILADSQDTANTTNPIEALTTTTSDIFEITRNNVFHNVLTVNDADAMTPAMKPDNATPTKSCFSGVRVVLPRLKSDEILEMQRGLPQRAREQSQSQSEMIDLTAESQLNDAMSSKDAVIAADVEKTPQRARPLTPSTRSCVRPQSDEIYVSSDDEGPSKSPARSGWLTKRTSNAASPQATPRSRRRLDKWFPTRANECKSLQTALQPRNIFQKSGTHQVRHLRTNNRLESPSIFSSDDE